MFFLYVCVLFSVTEKDEPVARFSGRIITRDEVPGKLSVDGYLRRLVFYEIAKEHGFVDSVRTRVKENQKNMLSRELYQMVVRGSEPNSAEPYILYKKLDKSIKAKLILTDNFRSAYRAWCDVMKGEDFGEVSEEYSITPELKKKEGDIGNLSWQYNPPVLVKKAFKMKEGEVSWPFYTTDGWNVLKVIEIEKKELPEYEEIKKSLISRIDQIKKREISQEHVNLIKWILDVEVEPRAIGLIRSRMEKDIRGRMQKPEFKLEDMSVVLARSNLGKYTISDFNDDIKNIRRFPPMNDLERAKSFIEWRLIQNFLVLEAKRYGVHRKPAFQKNFKNQLMINAIRHWKAHHIEPELKATEEEKREYYENNRKKYEVPEKRKVRLIEVKTREKALDVHGDLMQGADFEKIANELSTGPGKNRGGLIGYIRRDERGNIGEKAFDMRVGEISEPFVNNENWAIIELLDIQEKRIPEFENVKYRVGMDYRRHKQEKIENEIYEKYKDKYNVELLVKNENKKE